MSTRLLSRTVLYSLLLPCLYFGVVSVTYLYRLHAENSAQAPVNLPQLQPVNHSQSIVIFSPHPDDEALGCAGLIQQAVRSGASVKVVFLTNGDGFRVAVEQRFRNLHVGPNDYVKMASVRQEESVAALAILGLNRASAVFMGYPDRGLLPMWNDCWSPSTPFTSPYTKRNSSPYAITYHPNATYCGESILNDIETYLRESQPTDIYVTHPSDDHPDHTAASSFVTFALIQLRREGLHWAEKCRLRYYIVHRGDWPVPQGLYKNDALIPPAHMARLDTAWSSLPLSRTEVETKLRAIKAYSSQTAIMGAYLLSFARTNEIYGDLPVASVPRVADYRIKADGNVEEWSGIAPVEMDPVNDNLLRDFQRGGDIGAIYACRDAANLYLRVDTYKPVSNNVEFEISIRYFGNGSPNQSVGRYMTIIKPSHADGPGEMKSACVENRLEVVLPMQFLGYSDLIAVNVVSRLSGIQIDNTGYRFMYL